METFAEQESLGEIGRAFVEIVQDSPLDSPQEDELIGRFRAQALGLSALFAEIRDVYLDLIVTLR
jgi:hypothetical protein